MPAAASGPLWSHDGRLVAFVSPATNLTSPGAVPDANTEDDVYVVDRVTGHNVLVSAPDAAVTPVVPPVSHPMAFAPGLDANGNYVLAFWSSAPRLAAETPGTPDDLASDPGGNYDLFVARIRPNGSGAATVVSVERLTDIGATTGGDELLFRGSFSPDGTRLAFASTDDSDGLDYPGVVDFDLFTIDVATRARTRLTFAIGDALGPVWSPDGAAIGFTFASDPASEIIDQNRDGVADLPPDNNGVSDAYVLDLASGAVARVTKDPNGAAVVAAEGAEALGFSPDGAQLLFTHVAENLAGNVPANGVRQLASYDLASGAATLLSGTPASLADGATVDASFAPLGAPARPLTTMVVASRANNLPGLAGTNPGGFPQILLRALPGTYTMISRDSAGNGAAHVLEGSRRPQIAPVTVDGALAIAFDSDATNLDGVATAGVRTIYLATIPPTEGDLRLRAVSVSDGADLNGRTVAAPISGSYDVRLDIANDGLHDMTGVTVDVVLPTGMSITAWDPPSAIVGGGPGTYLWTVGDLVVGATSSLQLTLATTATPGPVTLTTEIATSDPDVDSAPGNRARLEDDISRFVLDVGANGFLRDDAFRGTIDGGDIIPVSTLLANDSGAVTFTGLVGMTELASQPGAYSLSVPGAWLVYEPLADPPGQIRFYGTASFSFQYTANDAIGNPLTASVSVAVNNRVPVAVDQEFSVLPGTPITIQWRDVVFATGNVDPDGDAIILASYGFPDPAAGTLQGFGPVNPNDPTDFGSIVFTPAAGFTGTTSIGYAIVDVPDLGGARRTWPYSEARLVFNVDTQVGADLSVEFDYGVYAEVGQTVQLQLRVINAGPASASGTVRLQHTANLEFPSAVAGFDPTTGLWTLPQVNAGSLAFLRLPVRIVSEGDGAVTAAIVSATAPDPNTVNNRMVINVNGFVREADVSVDVVFSPTSVLPGEPVTVTAVVSNAGWSAATNVVLTGLDYLLATHVIDSVTPSQGSCEPIAPTEPLQCGLGAIGAGLSASVSVIARPTMALFPDEVMPEVSVGVRARATANERDPSLANNEIYRAFSVRRPRADVSVMLAATPALVLPGEAVTIRATVTNAGPESATNVVLAGFDYLLDTHVIDSLTPTQGTCAPLPRTAPFQCAFGTMAAGASTTLTIVARPTMAVFPNEVLPEVSVGLRATVTATEQDPAPANNEIYRAFGVRRPLADLAVSIAPSPAVVVLDEPVTLTATVRNLGPDLASMVVLSGLDYIIGTHTIDSVIPSSGSCTAIAPGTSLQCALGNVAAGTSVTVTVVARPTSAVFGSSTAPQISVGARVRAGAEQSDPAPANNEAYNAYDVLRPRADLEVTLAGSATSVDTGSPITLTATIRNLGPQTASNVTVAGFADVTAFVGLSVTTTGGSCNPAQPGVDITCSLGTLAPRASVIVTFTGTPPLTIFDGNPNTVLQWGAGVSVQAQEHDPARANNSATVLFSVRRYDPPVARNDAYAFPEDFAFEDSRRLDVLYNDSYNVSIVGAGVRNGAPVWVSFDPAWTDIWIWVMEPNWHGVAEIVYTISDGRSQASAVATVVVSPVDDPLVARDDFLPRIAAGGVRTIGRSELLANDEDVDGDAVVVLDAGSATGVVDIGQNADQSITVRFDAGAVPVFRYTLTDGTHSGVATVRLNRTPVAQDDAGFTVTSQQNDVFIPLQALLGNDVDPDGDVLRVDGLESGYSGSQLIVAPWTQNGVPGVRASLIDTTFSGQAQFRYRAFDGDARSSPATVLVVVAPRNVAPQAVADAFTVRSGQVLSVAIPGVLLNDTDTDGDPLRVSRATTASNGRVAWVPDGSFTYTPNAGFVGTDTFTYWATDGAAESAPATVTVTVAPAVVAPPRVVVRLVGSASGGQAVTLEVANTGGSTATNVTLDQVLTYRLLGRGTVVLRTPLPIPVGTLGPGESRSVPLQLSVDPRIAAFLLVELGSYTTDAGVTQRFGGVQIVTP